MEANFDFISVTDKPALLALSSPEWLQAAHTALAELGYKVRQAATHGDFITNFTQVPYQVVIIEECFASDQPSENRSLEFIQNAQMHLRRHATVILVGDSYTSFNPLQAYNCGVHLVVNRSEILIFSQFIQKAVADNDLFLLAYRDAQQRMVQNAPRAVTT
jgi:hypothetical protein